MTNPISNNQPQPLQGSHPFAGKGIERKKTVGTDSKVGTQTHKMKAPFADILKDLERNKENLSVQNYRIAVETVKGIENLHANKEKLNREHLTQDVHQLTGMSIHAKENYPKVERFIDGIQLAVKTLQKAYGSARTDDDKLRLFRHGLEGGGCFENRIEALYHYLEETTTLAGSLKYEIMELNIRNNRPQYDPVNLDELIAFLQERQFFERQHLDKATFKDHPVIAELQGKDLIASDKPKDPIALIDEAFSTYTDYGKGEDTFLNHLSQTLSNLPKTELKVLLSKYFDQNPERKAWL